MTVISVTIKWKEQKGKKEIYLFQRCISVLYDAFLKVDKQWIKSQVTRERYIDDNP